MKRLLMCSFLLLPGCAFVEKANEAKMHLRLDLLFPFNAIPGLDSVLPHVAFDVQGGFEWHNAEDEHRHQMEMLKLQHELNVSTTQDDTAFADIMLNYLRKSDK